VTFIFIQTMSHDLLVQVAYLESFESKLNSETSEEKGMILKQNLDVLVPKYMGTISFAHHFLEQIQSTD